MEVDSDIAPAASMPTVPPEVTVKSSLSTFSRVALAPSFTMNFPVEPGRCSPSHEDDIASSTHACRTARNRNVSSRVRGIGAGRRTALRKVDDVDWLFVRSSRGAAGAAQDVQ